MNSLPDIHALQPEALPNNTPLAFCRPCFSFLFLLEGEALVEAGGKILLCGPGQFLLIPENLPVTVKNAGLCQGFEGSFTLEQLKDASYSVLRATAPLLQSFWFEDAVFLGALLKRMCTAVEDRDALFLKSGLDLLLAQLRPSGKVALVPDAFLQMVFQPNQAPLSVSAYAEQLQVTPNYLNKSVKAHTRRTAIDWIEIARLNMAKQLLKDPAIPISEVAGRIGIDDQSYFARFFKKKTGMTPSRFRKS